VTAEARARARGLFAEALQRPHAERAAFVDAASGSDPSLREEVLSLLHSYARSGSFLEDSGAAFECLSDALSAGSILGGFRIVRRIAQGGMGSVYEADQERPPRRVALKIVRAGSSSDAGWRRFELEVEVLARLQHPGIAQIYESGFDSGRPFFAMELIPGARTILEHARELGLGTRERLELFARVCDAVHHAHQRGVIHRDLKPSNVLVDASGQPKVIDFGVARVTEGAAAVTQLTSFGQLIGTLRYMSPEQCSGDPHAIDTRTDVYALGVVLYELLAGRLPYEISQERFLDAARVIRDEPPARLPPQARELRGDVEAILTKALEKSPARRYQSAAELAADLRRHVAGEAIHARPATLGYAFRAFARRHRAFVGGAAAVLLALLVGLAGTAWQMTRARREAQRAGRINDFLVSLLAPYGVVALPDSGSEFASPLIEVTDVLLRAAQTVDVEFADDPESRAEMLDVVGEQLALWYRPEASDVLRRSLEIHRDLHGVDDLRTALCGAWLMLAVANDRDPPELSADEQAIAAVWIEQLATGAPSASDELLQSAIRWAQRSLALPMGPRELLLTACLAAATERFGPDSLEVVRVRSSMLGVLRQAGRTTEAEREARDLIELARAQPHAARLRFGPQLSLSHVLRAQGDLEGALRMANEARDAVMEIEGTPPLVCETHQLIGEILIELGRPEEAVQPLRAAVQWQRKWRGVRRRAWRDAQSALARALEEQGDFEAALDLRQESLESARRVRPPGDPEISLREHELATNEARARAAMPARH
jgi:predicted Ser/Thr protein kinase/tetratricopeptide (TPR) repeat protein